MKIALDLSDGQAAALAQLVKRLHSRNLVGPPHDLLLPHEDGPANAALQRLRNALAAAGHNPR